MHVDQIVASVASQLVTRIVRRALAAAALAIFTVIAVYHFTAAGMIALDGQFGALDARLIVGTVYAALALISLIFLWALGRTNNTRTASPALGSPREFQLVMLVEAAILGYSLARKRERAS